MEEKRKEHQMDWDAVATYYDHWQEGNEAIQQELLRVAQLSLAGGRANAALAWENINAPLRTAKVSPRMSLGKIDEALQAHIALMEAKSSRNPFIHLDEQLQPASLAHRFALAYLTGTAPAAVLDWLKQVDRLDERVQYLVDGVCQTLVRLYLIKEREEALAAVLQEEQALIAAWATGNALPVDQTIDRKDELATTDTTSQEQGAEEDTSSGGVKVDATTTEDIKAGSKKDLMQRTHGFPWNKGPSTGTTRKIHAFLVDHKIINKVETPASVIASLFSEHGPAIPIRLLRSPGKLIHLLRWLSIHDELNTEQELELEDYSEDELRRFGRWLYPRFIGTFRNLKGKKFTSKQLNNATNRLRQEQLQTEKWYMQMDAMLKRAIAIVDVPE